MIMIRYNHPLKEVWDFFILGLTVLTGIEIPFRLAVGYQINSTLLWVEALVTLCFALDLCFNFFTLHPRPGHTGNYSLGDSRKRYLRGWFTIDLIAALPLFMFSLVELSGAGHLVRLLRLIHLNRLFKLSRAANSIHIWKKQHMINPSIFRLGQFLGWILLAAHWIACIWILLGGTEFDTSRLAESYVDSLYWTITTLTTVGYSDVTPHTMYQKLFTMLVMMVGVASYGYVFGNMASLLANRDVVKASHMKKVEEMQSFLRYRTIPGRLQHKVNQYYEHLWESRLSHNESEVLKDLPVPLRVEISLYINHEILKKVPIFSEASDEFLGDVVFYLEPMIYPPDTYFITKGDKGERMYFISSGEVEVISEDRQTVYATLAEGDFVGEMALLLEQPRTASVRTRTYCDLYTLSKSDFEKVLKHYPDFSAQIQEIVEVRAREIDRTHN